MGKKIYINCISGTIPVKFRETIDRAIALENELREIAKIANLDVSVSCGPTFDSMFSVTVRDDAQAEADGLDEYKIVSIWRSEHSNEHLATVNTYDVKKEEE